MSPGGPLAVGPRAELYLCPAAPYQVVLGLGHVWVVGPSQGLINAQGSGIVLLHLLELSLVLAEQGQVVELLGHVRVVAAQDLGVEGDGCDTGSRKGGHEERFIGSVGS